MEQSTNTFEHMIGATYTYSGKKCVVESIIYLEEENQYEVTTTDGKKIKETDAGMHTQFKPVSDVVKRDDSVVVSARKQSTDLDTLSDLLMSSMRDVAKDSSKVEQGLALAQQAQVVINAKKLQVEIAKILINRKEPKK